MNWQVWLLPRPGGISTGDGGGGGAVKKVWTPRRTPPSFSLPPPPPRPPPPGLALTSRSVPLVLMVELGRDGEVGEGGSAQTAVKARARTPFVIGPGLDLWRLSACVVKDLTRPVFSSDITLPPRQMYYRGVCACVCVSVSVCLCVCACVF